MQFTKAQQKLMLDQMREASAIFYKIAQSTHVHQFLEVNGFLAKLIDLYQRMHDKGLDFGTQDVVVEPHDMAYVAEKLDCIFGEALQSPAARKAFLEALEAKGGWKWHESVEVK